MLALTIEAILDFAGERSGKFRMIACEVVSHDAYGTPRDLFVAFFGVDHGDAARIARRGSGRRDRAAWQALLAEIEQMPLAPDGSVRALRSSRASPEPRAPHGTAQTLAAAEHRAAGSAKNRL